MSGQSDDTTSPTSQLSSHVFFDLLDSAIADIASECHRIAWLELDRNLEEEEAEMKLSEEARERVADRTNLAESNNNKYVIDIFGNTHPTVANDTFKCMNCDRLIAAGRFAPHLEKCMGKGRKARLKTTRSSTAAATQNLQSRSGSQMFPLYSPQIGSGTVSRSSNGRIAGSGTTGD
ncbi:SAGA-associated factor 11 [Zostera marina]|uniref:SAGA-associated factor 11 n=1 Tax=Zostera marina TaxID=29655 RepID=A0A0K9PFR2_ZOSMR|nr:SAGA-associated factor 11 [Zostera marina]